MHIQLSEEQLQNPLLEEAQSILKKCVHCGMCLSTCPTYLLLGDELDSPRGRIYQIKDMLENDSKPSDSLVKHVDRCLSCLNCMTTCPSGVDYMHLVDYTREKITKEGKRTWPQNAMRRIVATILPNRQLLRLALACGQIAKPILYPIRRLLPAPIANLIMLVPAFKDTSQHNFKLQTYPAKTAKPVARVALHPGCVQQALGAQAIHATIEFLTNHNVETIIAGQDSCCGALTHHMGYGKLARQQARRNIDSWNLTVQAQRPTAILHIAAGCGTTVKDYGHLFNDDELYRNRAYAIASICKDISEFIDTFLQKHKPLWRDDLPPIRVAYHSACSLRHGQKIDEVPIRLLRSAGFDVQIPAESHLCCGSAGTYNIFQGELSARLRDRKLENLNAVGAEVIATGNIGCLQQLRGKASIPIVHTIELLNWASGGVRPAVLK